MENINLNKEDLFVTFAFLQTLKSNPIYIKEPYSLKKEWKKNIYNNFKINNTKNLNPLKLITSAKQFWKCLNLFGLLNQSFLLRVYSEDSNYLTSKYKMLLECIQDSNKNNKRFK